MLQVRAIPQDVVHWDRSLLLVPQLTLLLPRIRIMRLPARKILRRPQLQFLLHVHLRDVYIYIYMGCQAFWV